MGDEQPKLPQSLYDAVASGEEIGRRPMSPRSREALRRLEEAVEWHNNNPGARREFSDMLRGLGEEQKRREAEIAALQGEPQIFLVKEDFTHDTDERFVGDHCVSYTQKHRVGYSNGTELVVRPRRFQVIHEEREVAVWGWVDSQGWIIRDWKLQSYLRKRWLQ